MSEISHELSPTDVLYQLHAAVAELNDNIAQLAYASREPQAEKRTDFDLPNLPLNQGRSHAPSREFLTAAIEVQNPYGVLLEVHASMNELGPVIMRVPPRSLRIANLKARELTLVPVGAPSGATPATLIRYRTPQSPGLWAFGGETGDAPLAVVDGGLTSAGALETLAVDQTAGGKPLAHIPPTARIAWLQNQGAGVVRFTDDGVTAPAAGEGFKLDTGADLWYVGPLASLKFFDQTGGGQTLKVLYYR